MHFINGEYCILIQISLKFVDKGPIDIGSGNALAPNRGQAIWINADSVHRHIYMALGRDELTTFSFMKSSTFD